MAMIEINGREYYYERHGRGQPVVLIAGITADHTAWIPIIEQLSAHVELICFDNRGVGQSDQSDEAFSIEDMADDTVALIEALSLDRPHVIGQSMGGAIAQTMAYRHKTKINKMVLCDSFMKLSTISTLAFEVALQLYQLTGSYTDMMRSMLPWAFRSEFLDQHYDELMRVIKDNPYPQTEAGYRRQCEALFAFDSRDWIYTVTTETLVLYGDEDIISFASEGERMAAMLPRARTHYVDYCGHVGIAEHADIYAQQIRAFLLD